jgi:pyruvate ferredoxin oxidoreductase gamma subunit
MALNLRFSCIGTGGSEMIEVRFHGRGGQGAKIASRILGQSGFLCGLYAQDFALFGAERRGAPVISFTRLSVDPVEERGPIDQPNLVVVMDDSLMEEARGQVFHGVHDRTPILVNAEPAGLQASLTHLPTANYAAIDLTAIALRLIGKAVVSATAAGAAAKSIPAITLDALVQAVRAEVTEFGSAAEFIDKNIAAAREAYERAPVIDLTHLPAAKPAAETALETPPYLASPQFAGPTIRQRGNAALRVTGNWRIERPEIELAKCKRCFLCYLYCPEAAMRLDADNFPHVDYEHCKGCLICYEECPTDAITRRLET